MQPEPQPAPSKALGAVRRLLSGAVGFLVAAEETHNWITLWDFRAVRELSLAAIGSATLFAVLLYLIATFVTADIEAPEDRDLAAFHARESGTYVGGLLVGGVLAVSLNLGAGSLGVGHWLSQNGLLVASLAPLVVALVFRRGWIHLVAATASLAFGIAFLVIYYPVLR